MLSQKKKNTCRLQVNKIKLAVPVSDFMISSWHLALFFFIDGVGLFFFFLGVQGEAQNAKDAQVQNFNGARHLPFFRLCSAAAAAVVPAQQPKGAHPKGFLIISLVATKPCAFRLEISTCRQYSFFCLFFFASWPFVAVCFSSNKDELWQLVGQLSTWLDALSSDNFPSGASSRSIKVAPWHSRPSTAIWKKKHGGWASVSVQQFKLVPVASLQRRRHSQHSTRSCDPVIVSFF